jgi:hypothetical protein
MARNDKAVYAPGELDRVRSNLGSIDQAEAKRLAEKLGGQVGSNGPKSRKKPGRGPSAPGASG